MPWDSSEPMPLLTRWWWTVQICCLRPQRFAFAFGVQPQRSRAGSFMLSVLLLATLAAITGLATVPLLGTEFGGSRADEDFGAGVITLLCSLWGGLFVATLATAIAFWALFPHADGRRRFGPWYSIVQYASCHCLFLAAFPVLMRVGLCSRPHLGSVYLPVFYFGTGLLCILLWAATLRAVVTERCLNYALASWAMFITIVCGIGGAGIALVGSVALAAALL